MKMSSRVIAIAVVGLLIFQMIAGMGIKETRAQSEEDTTLYVALQQDMPNFNNFDLGSNSVWKSFVIGWTFEGLSGLDPAGNIFPALAESWTEITEENGNYTTTVTLRSGINFSDGHPLTADDVIFSYKALRRGTTVSSSVVNAFDWDGDNIVSEDEINQSVIKIDDTHIKFILAVPYGQFFLTTLGLPIIPEHIWQTHLKGDGTVDTQWADDPAATIGTGPFKYGSGQKNVYREMVRNEDYWGKNFVTPGGYKIYPTNITRMYYKIYSSLDTAILALKSGIVDTLPWALTSNYVPELNKNPNTDVHFIADNGYFYLAFNMKRMPMGDIHFRKAVSYCIDKNTIVQRYMGGYGQAGDSCLPPFWADWYNSSVNKYSFNLDAARQELTSAGYTGVGISLVDPTGVPVPKLTILTPPADYDPVRVKAGEMIAKNLRLLGIPAEAKAINFDSLVARMNGFDYDMLCLGWSLSSDPIGNVFDILGPMANQNTFGFWSMNNENPYYNTTGGISTRADAQTQALADIVASLEENATSTFDRDEQIFYTKWAQGVIADALPVNVLYYRVNTYTTAAKWKGWIPFLGELFNVYSLARLTKEDVIPKQQAGSVFTGTVQFPDNVRAGVAVPAKVKVVNVNGDAVGGVTVSITSNDPANITLNPASGSTDSSGLFNFTVNTTGDVYGLLTITLSKDSVNYVVLKQFHAVPEIPNILTVEATLSKVFVGPGETSTITAKVRDGYGNPVAGAEVSIDTGLMAYGSLDHESAITDSNGVALLNYSASAQDFALLKNKHADVRLAITASKQGYMENNINTFNTYVVLYNTVPSAWEYIKIVDISSVVLNSTSATSNITVLVSDQNGMPLSGRNINVKYTKPSILATAPANFTTNSTGHGVLTVSFNTSITTTSAVGITFMDKYNLTSVSDSATLVYNAGDGATGIYGGWISYNSSRFVEPDQGTTVDGVVHIFDQSGQPFTGKAAFIIAEPSVGDTAGLVNAPDYMYNCAADWTYMSLETSADNSVSVVSGLFVSDLMNDSEIEALGGAYSDWDGLLTDGWTGVDTSSMTGLDIQNGEASFSISSNVLALTDSVVGLYFVPAGEAGFYVSPDESVYYWKLIGTSTLSSQLVVRRTDKIVAPQFTITTPVMQPFGARNTTTFEVTVFNQSNMPVSGVDVSAYCKDYGVLTPYFSATVTGPTNASGKASGTIVASYKARIRDAAWNPVWADLSSLAKQSFYIGLEYADHAAIPGSTQLFDSPINMFLDTTAPMLAEAGSMANFTVTAYDHTGTPLSDVNVSSAGDFNFTNSNGQVAFSQRITPSTENISIHTFAIQALKPGYVAASYTLNTIAFIYKALRISDFLVTPTTLLYGEDVVVSANIISELGLNTSASKLYLNGQPVSGANVMAGQFVYTIVKPPVGNHTIELRVVDTADVMVSVNTTILVVPHPPQILNFAVTPAAAKVGENVTVSANITAEGGINETASKLFLNDIEVVNITAEGPFTYNLTGLSAGSYIVKIRVVNLWGNTTNVSANLEVSEPGAPEILAFNATPAAADLGQNVVIAGEFTSESGIKNATLSIDGVNITLTLTGNTFTHTVVTPKVGNHTVILSLLDNADRYSNRTIYFEVAAVKYLVTSSKDGVSQTVFEGATVNLTAKGNVSIAVTTVGTNNVVLTIGSKSITVNTTEKKKIDTDNNGKEDLEITLNSVSGISANLTFKNIDEPSDEEEGSSPGFELYLAIFAAVSVVSVVITARRRKGDSY
ncbi:MAG: ABC transporter substrate-binding protein [Thermoplasmata archaeon]